MAASFYFYDLETSGFDARQARIMQFAGQCTDSNLKPIGEPHNILIKMSPDVVPDPDAVLITGITPQSTLADGVTEAEFLKIFFDEIVTDDTCFLGYNTVRFDDEFMRNLLYRNMYDPYEWQWANGCSRWDMLDVVRMTRALRPEGIKWPFTDDGKPTNRLELLTKVNDLDHYAAHDALSDVHATIAVAQLIRDKQPKLFEYMFDSRSKKKVEELASTGQPFVYSSGKYPAEYEKTAVVAPVAKQPQNRGVYVWDLRHDPAEFATMSPAQLVDRWQYTRDPDAPPRLPLKLLQFNHCPAVAPLGVMNESSRERLQVDLDTIKRHLAKLHSYKDFSDKILEAVAQMDEVRDKKVKTTTADAEQRIYDGFFEAGDKQTQRAIRAAEPHAIMGFVDQLKDGRLKELLPRYKARNYPEELEPDERREWERYCRTQLMKGGQQSRMARYFSRLQELAASDVATEKMYLLEELQLYGQSIIPFDDDSDDGSEDDATS